MAPGGMDDGGVGGGSDSTTVGSTLTRTVGSVVITGASSGLGLACARAVLREGPEREVVLACREVARGEAAAGALQQEQPGGRVRVVALDLGSLDSVRTFPHRLEAASAAPVAALVCNAGVQHVAGRHSTADGFEASFGVNHLGHFLLVHRLLRRLAPGARVVVVSSDAHDPRRHTGMPAPVYGRVAELSARAPAPGEPPGRFGRRAYTTSKLCNVLFAYELVRRLPALGRPDARVNVYAPGVMPDTRLVREWPRRRRALAHVLASALRWMPGVSTAARSGSFLARLAVDPAFAETTGGYFSVDRERRSSAESYDAHEQHELWEGSAALVGLREAR